MLAIDPSQLGAVSQLNPADASIRVWSSVNGLPEESIFGIAETSDGNVWLATRDGLTRFDGNTFRTLHPATQTGMRENSFGALLTVGGTLWMGARDFLASALPDSFQSYVNPQFKFLPFPRRSIDRFGTVGMQLGSNGQIWLQRGDGVYEFDPKNKVKPVLRFLPPEGEQVSGFYEGYDGRVFLASESGVRERVQDNWKLIDNSPRNVNKMLLTRDEAIWMFAPDGLHKLLKGKATRLDLPGNDRF